MIKKIILNFFCLAVVCLAAFFVYGNFYAGALSSNGSACTDNSQCQSGNCASKVVCCAVGQCGWGAEDGNPIMCIANNHYKSNQYLNGVCRNGAWMTVPGGWGCSAWPCDSGACSNNNCSGSVPNGAPRGSSVCASGYANNTWCCASGQCGSVADPWCFYSGQSASNLWFNGVCRSGGAWKTVTGGIGCDPNGVNFACDVATDQCVNNTCVSTLLPNGSSCSSDSQCSSNFCSSSNVCMSCGAGRSTANGGSCNCGSECQSGNCGNYVCTALCSNECGSAGIKQCSGSGYRTCGNYDTDSCLEWSAAVTSCGANQICSGGACAAGGDDCTSNYSKKCYNGDVYWYDSCGVRGTLYDTCAASESCASGACAADDGGCTEEYSKKCYNGDVYWYDSCNNRGDIYDNCSSEENCSAGKCVAGGDDCTAYSSKKCDGGNVYWYDSCGVRGDLYQNCGSNTLTANYQCKDNWLQQGMISKDCVSGACVQTSVWNNTQDCFASGKVCKNGVCVAGDSVAPVISGLSPSGTVYNSGAVLAANTSENAECRYSWYDKSFDEMTLLFKTSNKLYHSASISLKNYGDYVYYVRCRDASGNASQISGKITFRYASASASNTPAAAPAAAVPAAADKTPPEISSLAPSGRISSASTTISAITDEKAVCKYDIADTSYDSMENLMDSAEGGTRQSKIVALPNPGNYNYYIRCKDNSGNKNADSAKISFSYALPQAAAAAPVISDLQPASTVYQKSVSLTMATDKTAECRWAVQDQDFDMMPGLFSTTDGQIQQATVDLSDYGQYAYYVRCKDSAGNKSAASSVIGFEYKNPDRQAAIEIDAPPVQEPVECEKPATGTSDGECDTAADCVCDPDCLAGGDQADPDCADAAGDSSSGAGNIWIIVIPAVLVVVVIIILIAAVKRRGGTEEDDENMEVPQP